MDTVVKVFQYITGLGIAVVVPLIIFLLGLLAKVKFSTAIRSALTIGVGFIGINLVVGLLITTLIPVTTALAAATGLQFTTVDIGGIGFAGIHLATAEVLPFVYLFGILLNIVLLAIGFTKTLDVDMWNYHHFIYAAGVMMIVTNNLVIAIVFALAELALVLKLADIYAPTVNKYFELPGISLPHFETITWAPLTSLLDKIWDKIPGLNKWKAAPEDIQKKWGILGETLVIGVVLGLIIAVIGYFSELRVDFAGTLSKILTTAISLGAVMLLMPRMIRILMEGLIPLSEGVRAYITKRFPGKDIYIGLDAAVALGKPAVISTALIMVPITLFLGIGLAKIGLSTMLPFADLALLPFFVVWPVAHSKGNLVRSVLSSTIVIALGLMIGSALADVSTKLAIHNGIALPAGAVTISSIDTGLHWTIWAVIKPLQMLLGR